MTITYQHSCGGYYVATTTPDGSHYAPSAWDCSACYSTPHSALRAERARAGERASHTADWDHDAGLARERGNVEPGREVVS